MSSVLILIIAIALVAVVIAGGLLGFVARSRRSIPVPPPIAEPSLIEREPSVDAPEPSVVTTLERPEGRAGRLVRLRQRLAGTDSALGRGLLALISRDHLDADAWEDLEDTLITADLGVAPAQELVERLRNRLRVEGSSEDTRTVLREELVSLVDPTMNRALNTQGVDGKPAVVLVVGVNGAGKTTSVGKIARVLVADDRSVLLGAADTFRAAAGEQLTTWGDRVGVDVILGPEGSDPASVAFASVESGIERGVDVVLVDTAGRLQNKQGLMDELLKIIRVVKKVDPDAPHETLLVLDATTGGNAIAQAREFKKAGGITGLVLTKLDGTAKGGVAVAVVRELDVPIRYVGVGESVDDLVPFDAGAFVDALLGA
jgi:fused signal recognition particle receptor